MTGIDLASHVSGKIARTNPLQGGPEMEAWGRGASVMADTWGNYTSRLGEILGPDVALTELLAKLCIDHADLSDPEVHFRRQSDFRFYKDSVNTRIEREVTEEFTPEVKRLHLIIDAVMDGYKVPDRQTATAQAEDLDDEIDAADATFDKKKGVDKKEKFDHMTNQSERTMRRDALLSGVVIPLPEFAEIMLSTNVTQSEDAPSVLAREWVHAVRLSIRDFRHEFRPDEKMPASLCVGGNDLFADMKTHLASLRHIVTAAQDARWAEISPVFYARDLSEHPLISGVGEK